jgi:hypothetical protein
MKWLPREKRNPFIIVVLITATVLALICFGLIHSQNTTLSQVADSRKTAGNKLQEIERTIKNSDLTAHELDDVTYSLTRAEEDMATDDYNSWTYNTMSLFKKQYKVEIPEIGHPDPEDVNLLPNFPYKQIRFSINGTAYFHDIGKFVSDFENDFPHARMINLIIEPAGSESERLSFRMEIIALVKPNAS